MLTSYMVTCPHHECGWQGSLLPRGDSNVWKGSVPTTSRVVFECPQCGHEWPARVVGDDVVPLPLRELAPLP
jgi:predicted RNA-binding Zn-ribbon protein involved in translation (DUF1610 family)